MLWRPPAYSLLLYDSVAEIDTDIPGPGAYDYKPLYREGSRLTFGPPFKTSTNDLPPPNAYDIKDGIGTTPSHRSSVPSWGVRSRTFFGSCYYDATKAGIPGRSPSVMHAIHKQGGHILRGQYRSI